MSDSWTLGDLAKQDGDLPDVGEPLIPSGPQVSAGVPWANDLTDRLSRGVARLPGAMMSGLAETVATPGKLMQPNPYPEGSEAASWYDDQRQGAMVPWATGMALNTMGTGAVAGVPLRAGETALGAGAVRPVMGEVAATKLGDVLNPRLRAKAEGLFGKWSQYAEEYPPIGPPELREKLKDAEGNYTKKPGPVVPYSTMEEALALDAQPGYFLEKKLLPEVEQFQKDRKTIQDDMAVHGYTPYFDPAKRFDVDPKKYGPFADTAVEAAPKTAKTAEEWAAKYGTEDARARLQAGFEKGQTVPDSDRWYHMGQLEKAYIDELGPQAGREAFKREFADSMAATTGGQNPYDNNLMSQYVNYMDKRGERLPERSYNLPFPIGGRYASGNIAQAQKYFDTGATGFDPAVNPKRYDFSSAFQGNKNAATIDEQMMGAIVPKVTIPQWYGPATQTVREEAAKAGVDARGFQDVGWAGLKAGKEGEKFDYEGPMINHINRSIETTHRLTGMPRDEIVRRGLIRKEIPMYGLAAAAAVPAIGSLARQDDYQ